MKLLTKIALIILSGAILATVVTSYFVFTSTKSALQTVIKNGQEDLGREIMDKIDRLLFTYYIGIQNIGEEESIEQTLNGKLTDSRVIERRIKELQFLTGPWDVLKIVNFKGEIVVSNTQNKAGKYLLKESVDSTKALKEALGGHIYYSDFLISKETGRPTMIFAAPIRDQDKPNQPIVGAVLGYIAWPAIAEIVNSFNLTNELNLYTHDGVFIATNQETPVNLFTNDDKIARSIEAGKEPESKIVALTTYSPSIGHLSYKGNRWVLFVKTPIAVVFAPAVSTARNIVLFLMPIILLITILILKLLKRFVVQPVTNLTEVTNIISRGNISKRAEIGSKDEIGELAKAFNQMTEKLQQGTRELKEEQARLLASINSLSFGFIILDKRHRVLLKNTVITKLFELKNNDEISIDHISGFLGGHFDIKAEAERCMKGKTVCEIKEIVLGAKFLRGIIAPIIMIRDHEEIIGYVFLLEDITEAKILERSKEDFFAVASHELRTPLTAIRGNVSMIQDFFADKITDKEVLKMLDDIHVGSVRLIKIVNDFLNASSLEQKKISFKIENFDLTDLITETLFDLNNIAADKGLYLNFETENGLLPKVRADRERTKQVIINIIGNAIHFTEKGGITVRAEKANYFLKVSVMDTGLGVSFQNQELLFRKFQVAAEKTLSRDVASGTGLGLYISKLLIEAMGGQISLEKSTLGHGSVFSFTLPTIGNISGKAL